MTIPPSTSGWTLGNIRAKVRSITGTPSTSQLSDDQVDAYINNYYVYTMPHELKVQIDNKFLDFKTVPGQNVYSFPGAYLTDSPGAYADGFPLIFYQDPDIFYQDWPQQYNVDSVAAGDGTTMNFSGSTQGFPIINGTFFITDGFQVLQDSGDNVATVTLATGNGGTVYSGTVVAVPIDAGSFTVVGGIGDTTSETFSDNGNGILTGSSGGSGTINYASGSWTLMFASAVSSGLLINATYSVAGLNILLGDGSGTLNTFTGQFSVAFSKPPSSSLTVYDKYIAYQANRPQGCLFFENEFTFMPVPDQAYQIRMQGFILPDGLSNDDDIPKQPEWGALIAYGASFEVFNDRGDLDAAEKTYATMKRYENVALSRTIQQYTAEQSVPRF